MTAPMTAQTQDPAPRIMMQASGVRKSFGSLEVLKGIDLALPLGEVMCLLGQSGSGKSTFLRCINPVSYTHLTLPTSDLV